MTGRELTRANLNAAELAAFRVAEAFRASVVAEMGSDPVLSAVESLAHRLRGGLIRRKRCPWQVMQVLIAFERALDALEHIENGIRKDPYPDGYTSVLSGLPCDPVQILKEAKE